MYGHVGEPISIGNNVQIGAGAIILPGVSICNNVIIGAGCIVSRSISEPGVYVGVPARKIR
ncbi:Galactoside O-acetyltransferase [compost metagenome]